jgi:NADH:ubiquinone oxidoreductase subunit 6 (subunit J)
LEGAIGSGRAISALIMVAVVLGTLGAVISVGAASATGAFDHSVEAVGRALFGPLIVPFELTAPLLLVAVVGAVVIWRRQERAR